MLTVAKIRRHSAVWRLWHSHHRTGGELHGVTFQWTQGNDYLSGVLTAHQIRIMDQHRDVMLEMVGVPLLATPTIVVLSESPPPLEPVILQSIENDPPPQVLSPAESAVTPTANSASVQTSLSPPPVVNETKPVELRAQERGGNYNKRNKYGGRRL